MCTVMISCMKALRSFKMTMACIIRHLIRLVVSLSIQMVTGCVECLHSYRALHRRRSGNIPPIGTILPPLWKLDGTASLETLATRSHACETWTSCIKWRKQPKGVPPRRSREICS